MSQYIEIENLKRVYIPSKNVVVKALDGVSFSVEEGSFISIIGSSGSGKSTFLNILGGLDWGYTGNILIDGKDIREHNQNYYRRYIVGTVFQQFYLIPSLTVEENILLPTKFQRNINDINIKDRLEYILEETGLGNRRKHYPKELSGGQAQRVAIARALIDSPRIVLADEPTGNLDSHTGEAILELLKSLNKSEGTTMILVTHDNKISKATEKTITLVDGKNV
ncbi:MAG: ABC transporter ATP-binding protein [Candidatus Dojkabacteria bacterium]